MIINIFNGFCMALADSVPGVSGGTIAFILGFYEDLLEAVNNITSRNKEKIRASIFFLIKLLIGWIIGMTTSVLFLSSMFERNIYFLSSLFIGLTTASIVYIIKNETKIIKKNNMYLLFTLVGVVLVVLISTLRGKIIPSGSIIMSELNAFECIYIFIAGLVTISAMVLPGISGSTLLLIMGVYIPIINSLDKVIKLDFSVLPGLLLFIGGVIFGIVVSVRLIRNAFRKHRSKMIYFVIGLTIGSLFAIMNGPRTMNPVNEVVNLDNFNIIGFITGIALLLFLEIFKRYSIRKIENTENIK